jgi:hypothetical protein
MKAYRKYLVQELGWECKPGLGWECRQGLG